MNAASDLCVGKNGKGKCPPFHSREGSSQWNIPEDFRTHVPSPAETRLLLAVPPDLSSGRLGELF